MLNENFVQSMARALLQMAAGYLVSKGIVESSAQEGVVGGCLTLIGVLWSYFTHKDQPPA